MKRTPLPPRTKPLARGKPPRAKKPISRSGKALVRSSLPRQQRRIKNRGRSRFPKHRQPEYKAWIKTLPCVLTGKWHGTFMESRQHYCLGNPLYGAIDPMHIKSQGAGADDLGALVPCCHYEHMRSHEMGIKSWAAEWFVAPPDGEPVDELRRIAAEVYPQQYEKAVALGWKPGGEF